MTDSDRDRFSRAIVALGEVFNEPLSAARIALYFEALKQYAIEDLERATRMAARTLHLFPKLAALTELLEGDPEVRAHEAWERVRQAIKHVSIGSRVDFGDLALHAAVQRMGGWRDAWLWDLLPLEELGYKALEFRKLYAAYRRDLPPDPPKVLGGDPPLGNPVRVIDRRGLPKAPARRALPAPEPTIALGENIPQLLADLATHRRPPAPGRRALKALTDTRPLDVPPTPEEEARHAQRQQEELDRFRQHVHHVEGPAPSGEGETS